VSTLAIFVIGLLVTGITLTAVVLIGLSEASDPAHSRLSDLSELERNLVGRSRAKNQETDNKTRKTI
jgi:hypothetical protein